MPKFAEAFQNWVARKVTGHGSLGKFCEDSGFSRSTVENWRDGASIPKLDALDKLVEKRVLRLAEIFDPNAAALDKLSEAAHALDAARAAVTAPPPSPARAGVIALLEEFDDSEMPRIEQILRARLSGKEFAKNPIKPNKLVR
jgi:transcriptional regulator with XRE-family HTH domain